MLYNPTKRFQLKERNDRLFAKKKRSHDQVIDAIKSNIRLKLLTCKFKKTMVVQMLLQRDDSMHVIGEIAFGCSGEEDCQLRVVLFFPSPRFFPLGFSWEGFLKRQSQLVYYTPSVLLMARCGDSCSLKWFLPIGDLVSVFS
ncbi:hypothetical protein Tco_0474747 [Tanacetum coccineum]